MFVTGWEISITALAYFFCLALVGSCLAIIFKFLFRALYRFYLGNVGRVLLE